MAQLADWTDADLKYDFLREAAPLARSVSAEKLEREEHAAWVQVDVAESAGRDCAERVRSAEYRLVDIAGKAAAAARELYSLEKLVQEAQEQVNKERERTTQAKEMARAAEADARKFNHARMLLIYGPSYWEDEEEGDDD